MIHESIEFGVNKEVFEELNSPAESEEFLDSHWSFQIRTLETFTEESKWRKDVINYLVECSTDSMTR